MRNIKNKVRNARKIAVASNVIGAGKTTVAVNLALTLAGQRHRVLLVDTTTGADADSIGNWIESDRELGSLNLSDFLLAYEKAAIQPLRSVFLIRGGSSLVEIDRRLTESTYDRRSGNRPSDFGSMFGKPLSFFEHTFDFIIFDTPAHWGLRNIGTLSYADELVVPINLTDPAPLALHDYIYLNLEQLHRICPSAARLGYILPIGLNHTQEASENRLTELKESFREMLRRDESISGKYGDTVICPPIHHSVRFGRCYEDEQENYSEAEWIAENRQIVREFRQVADVMLGEGKPQPVQIAETAVA